MLLMMLRIMIVFVLIEVKKNLRCDAVRYLSIWYEKFFSNNGRFQFFMKLEFIHKKGIGSANP
jgi:hypothetical protein